LIADHAVVSNQTNSQPNVIAAADNLIKGVTNVTIQGVSSRATYASIKSGTNIGNILVGDCMVASQVVEKGVFCASFASPPPPGQISFVTNKEP
jgi:hypothetical protein